MKFGNPYDEYAGYGIPVEVQDEYYPPAQPTNNYGFLTCSNGYTRNHISPFGFKERSINRQIAVGQQIEDKRAQLTAQALANTANLVNYEQELMQCNPAGSDYYQQILENYVLSAGDTIQSFGKPKNYFNNNNNRRR